MHEAAGYHLRMTRDLDAAKDYFHVRYAEAPDARYGLVASSRDKILQEHGVKALGVGDRHSANGAGALLASGEARRLPTSAAVRAPSSEVSRARRAPRAD